MVEEVDEIRYFQYNHSHMISDTTVSEDKKTAAAFATSWNNLPEGSIYTRDQFEDFLVPISRKDVEGKRVLELGCGSAGLMVHMADWNPAYLEGVDLGDSVIAATRNMQALSFKSWKVGLGDLTEYTSGGFDLTYCVGVIHHLKNPKKGFDALVRNAKPGGRFHGWVYAREGNTVIVWIVDPIRKCVSRLPWWFTKYFVATPLMVPFFFYAKTLASLPRWIILKKLPLYEYSLWISKREFAFFRHIAFDQLVTPQTAYIPHSTIEAWLANDTRIDQSSTYITNRNGNSWRFGGMIKR